MARNYIPQVKCDNCSDVITNGVRQIRKPIKLGEIDLVIEVKPLNADTVGRFKKDLCEPCVFKAVAIAAGDPFAEKIVDEGNTDDEEEAAAAGNV